MGAHRHFVPSEFVVPTALTTPAFRLEPLGSQHNLADHAAWTSSIEHIRATPGFAGSWPPPAGMSPDDNLVDLERHASDFAERVGFTYTVIDRTNDEVIGCVYIYPSRSGDVDAEVRSWVRADRSHMDAELYEAVRSWLSTDWPFDNFDYAPR